MTKIIIGVAIFVASISVMIVSAKTFPKTVRLIVSIIMVELVCVSGVLIAMGLYDMGLMD